MSGKVAKPKEDKDASKGKASLSMHKDCFAPKSQFFFSSDANHAPIHSLHGAQNHPLRSLKTISNHWWWTISSTVHVDTAVSDLSRCCCRPICCTMCCFEITCFTCIDLVIVHKEAIIDKAKDHFVARCHSLRIRKYVFTLKSNHSFWNVDRDVPLCEWHPVEMSLCFPCSHLIRILSRTILTTSV